MSYEKIYKYKLTPFENILHSDRTFKNNFNKQYILIPCKNIIII